MQAVPERVLVHWRNSESELHVEAERRRGDAVANVESADAAMLAKKSRTRPVAPEMMRRPRTPEAAA